MLTNVKFPARRHGDHVAAVLHGVLAIFTVAVCGMLGLVAYEVHAKAARPASVYIAQ